MFYGNSDSGLRLITRTILINLITILGQRNRLLFEIGEIEVTEKSIYAKHILRSMKYVQYEYIDANVSFQ